MQPLGSARACLAPALARVFGTVLAMVLAMALATVVLLAGCSSSSSGAATAPRETRPAPTGSGPAATGAEPAADAAATEAAVRRIYTTRAAGLARGDLAAWLQGLSGSLVEEQRAIFGRMRALHAVDVVVTDVTQLGGAGGAGGAGGGQGANGTERHLQVRLSYRLAGFDTAPRPFALDVTAAHSSGASPVIMITASRPADRPQPWDLPDLQVRRSPAVLVAVSGTAARVDDIARGAGTAAGGVAAVLGTARPAVVVAPASDDLAARLLGRQPADLDQVSAVTDGPLEGGRAGADRVVIVPGAWSSLTDTGREVVLAHELTHVTTRAEESTHTVPLWLSEGLAEYVAYHAVRLPERTIVGPALEQVRVTGVPTTWPDDPQFEPDTSDLSAAYGLALLACRSIADRHGQAALVRLYRAATTGPVDAAFRAIGTDAATESRAWQSRIELLLHPPGQP
ncbi:MAG: hypothetical protein ACTHJJ_01770 [Intrasporangium sp.]|uniref:hypothetical protein n=1 Tax=Intrasporangium sp. TaxID=1925024 RepID=UPI003F7E042B